MKMCKCMSLGSSQETFQLSTKRFKFLSDTTNNDVNSITCFHVPWSRLFVFINNFLKKINILLLKRCTTTLIQTMLSGNILCLKFLKCKRCNTLCNEIFGIIYCEAFFFFGGGESISLWIGLWTICGIQYSELRHYSSSREYVVDSVHKYLYPTNT